MALQYDRPDFTAKDHLPYQWLNARFGQVLTWFNTLFVLLADCVSANTANKIVKRDNSGNFSAGTITAETSFVGDLTGDVTGDLTGDVTGDVTGNADTATLAADSTKVFTKTEAQLLLAFKQAQYPVGTVYENGLVTTNPATLLGFGTWVALGPGRTRVCLDTSQTEFDTIGETGGSKNHTNSISEMAAHDHDEYINGRDATTEGGYVNGTMYGRSGFNSGLKTGSTGSGSAYSIMNPYIVTCAWIRTA